MKIIAYKFNLYRYTMDARDAATRAAERELEVMREAMAARYAELANLQLALEFFNNEVESGERRAYETVALREVGPPVHVKLTLLTTHSLKRLVSNPYL